MNIIDQLLYAKKINNYDKDATGGGLWTSTTHFKCTVPASKRWFILGGVINRDVNATVSILIYDASDDLIHRLASEAAGTGGTAWPNTSATDNSEASVGIPIMMNAGEYVDIVFGVAQGANAYASCVVLEIDV